MTHMKKILCICLSSTIQRTITFENLSLENVNRSKHYRQDASGKAVNSARVLTQLKKGSAITLCPLGKENEETFKKLAQKDGLELLCTPIPGYTRECWTLLDSSRHTTTELVVSEPLPQKNEMEKIAKAEIKLLKLMNENLCNFDAILLAGSKPSFWSEDLYPTIAGIAKDAKKLFLADFIGNDLQKTLNNAVPDIIKINAEEFLSTFSLSLDTKEESLKETIIKKSMEYNNIFVITRGNKSTYAAEKGSFFEFPSEIVEAVNTTACGDSFNAGFLYEYINSKDIFSALKMGTWCAARNAESEVPGSII